MNEKLCSDSIKKTETELELWAALVAVEGVRCQWHSGQPLSETAIQVEDNPNTHISHPWNPASPDAELFFTSVEPSSVFDDLDDTEIRQRSQVFFSQLETLWPSPLEVTLAQRFASRMPRQLLTAIATQVQSLVASTEQTVVRASNSVADQLIQCVKDIVPGLAEDDFSVLARPLAVAMRNGGLQSAIEAQIAQVPDVNWEQLSELQQARLSLAIARFAIEQEAHSNH